MHVKQSLQWFGVVATILASFGCVRQPSGDDDGEGGSESGDVATCEPDEGCLECPTSELYTRSVDILVVVDGSAGSAGAQARLARGLEHLIAELEASEFQRDYRIAITTTDMGPPACDPLLTTPEYGQLTDSSCRQRLGDFVDDQGQDFSALCTDACSLDSVDRLPTTIDGEPDAAPRPWIEHDGERLNLPDGVDPAEALRCMALTGVSSCGFESPLAAMVAAVEGSSTLGHLNYGFFRPYSDWAFVVVSDASDCSWSEAGLAIFDPDGERTFWSDPLAEAPTPAVCWNAGTDCASHGEVLACDIMDYDVFGEPTGFPNLRVLERAAELTEGLEFNDWGRNEFLFFTGETIEGEVVYQNAEDPAFALEHGVGPGCEGPDGTVALPPVRELRFLDAIRIAGPTDSNYVQEHTESICAENFDEPFAELGQRIRESVDQPLCAYQRPCDVDPSTEILDIDCRVSTWSYVTNLPNDVLECARGDDGAYLVDAETQRPAMPDDQAELCYLARVDSEGLSADPLDDVWPACVDKGAALGFELVTRDGHWPHTLFTTVDCTKPD
jgi:hypothetical protein